MNRKDKKILLLTCTVILLPVLIGILLWNRLPDEMAMHFNPAGQPDNFMPKIVGIVLIPAFGLVMQFICVYFAGKDTSAIHSKWGEKIICWIVPVILTITNTFLYWYNLGYPVNIATWVVTFCCLLMMVLGNLMPKSSMNSFFGARVPWAYKSDAAWKLTQRINGWGMVLGSIASLILTWCGYVSVALVVLIGAMIVSLIWSWIACRHLPKKAGNAAA